MLVCCGCCLVVCVGVLVRLCGWRLVFVVFFGCVLCGWGGLVVVLSGFVFCVEAFDLACHCILLRFGAFVVFEFCVYCGIICGIFFVLLGRGGLFFFFVICFLVCLLWWCVVIVVFVVGFGFVVPLLLGVGFCGLFSGGGRWFLFFG